MKIAYIRNTFPKNSETFILEEILYLKRAGHEIRVFSKWCDFSHLNNKMLDEELLSCVVYDQAKRRTMRELANTVRKFCWQWIFSRNYRTFFGHQFTREEPVKSGLKDYFLRQRKLLNFADYIASRISTFWEIWQIAVDINNLSLARKQFLLRRESFIPDHIHCPFLFPWDAQKLFQFVSRFPDKPYSVTLRSRDIYLSTADKQHVALRNALVVRASKVFTISDFNKRTLTHYFKSKVGLTVIHSSIDTNFFTPCSSDKKVHNRMLTVARLVPKKGLEVLIDACAVLHEAGQDFNLSIVGEGQLKSSLLKKIAVLNLQSKIQIIGPYRHAKIKSLLAESEVFVLPCVVSPDGDRDILPNSLKEAMAMKLVVVTSDISGIEELVEDGVTGLLAQPNNASDLAEKMLLALSNKEFARRAGENGRQTILRSFSIEGEGKKFNSALVSLQHELPQVG